MLAIVKFLKNLIDLKKKIKIMILGPKPHLPQFWHNKNLTQKMGSVITFMRLLNPNFVQKNRKK